MVSPYARRLAAERGVDLATVSGTGPGGAVLARDIEAAAAAAAAPAVTPVAPELTGGLAPRVAAAMARSKREIPHYHLTRTVDLTTPLEWLRAANESRSVDERVLPAALLLAAIARGVAEVPRCNGHWVDGAFRPSPVVDLAVAIAQRDGGLVAPVIADAATKTLQEVMDRLRELTSRTRRGGLRAADLAEGSVTVTMLGDRGADSVLGVIFPPQVALVGVGRIVDRVLAVDGAPQVRPTVELTLAADHRVTGGHEGSRCLDAIVAWLERPGDVTGVRPGT
jgi:pyruvate dehydrogenase E2 component (dihydrolipoamide acetyltransferase)